jgi:hypothetical protein
MNKGIKYDNCKPDYSLIPPNALDDVARVLTYGATKYDRDNWKELENLDNRYFAAAQRHLWALRKGETYDDETGIHHGAHAICCMMFIIEFNHVQTNQNKV